MVTRLLNKKAKIFVISFQRTGTTSTGQFFKDHGFKVATWPISRENNWTVKWLKGDFESIFKSLDFKNYQVFEDDPWWLPEFYKQLFHRFPNSKFILLERDPDKWFDSMISHSGGKSLGNTHLHSIIYNREKEYHERKTGLNNAYTDVLDNLLPLNESHREHYKQIYINSNREIKLFFQIHDQNRFFYDRLEDSKLWQKMSEFFNIKLKTGYSAHKNKTERSK